MEALTLLQWIVDALTGLGLLWLAYRALTSPHLFKAVVLFVSFGLLMAFAWLRLDAPDVALAEVAIGAGLTGALLLAALARLPAADQQEAGSNRQGRQVSVARSAQYLCAALIALIASGCVYTVLSFPGYFAGLSAEVAANLDRSGVSNPVTAVLLNFRGYDTLLEMLVLLLALLGVWSLGGVSLDRAETASPVLVTMTRVLIPLLVLYASYLLWLGAHAPGGAFQAGAVLGAAGVLLLLAGWRPDPRLPLRLLLVAGPGLFLATALVTIITGPQLLQYPSNAAPALIIFLEIASALSIGTTLSALFLSACPDEEGGL